MKWIVCVLLCLALIGVSGPLNFALQTEPATPLITEVVVSETEQLSNRQLQKTIIFKNRGYFFVRQVHFKSDEGDYVTALVIPGSAGTVQYYDAGNQLKTIPLTDGVLPTGSILNIRTDRYHMLLGQPYVYEAIGSGTMASMAEGSQVQCQRRGDAWLITFRLKQKQQHFGILWGVGSDQPLMDLTHPDHKKVWGGSDLTLGNRIGYDGYYYKSPVSYNPATANSYWRIPSMYLANTLIKNGNSLGYDLLGNALLLIAKDNLNDEGYFPSLPESTWLKNDYAIGAGFFDTRFNADAGETLLLAYQKFGIPIYRELYLKVATYYIQHIQDHYYEVEKEGLKGWLVEDYASAGGAESHKTHVSLNHQLQAIKWFLELYGVEKVPVYDETAQKLLDGIKATKHLWLRSDGNLEYGYMPDGTMGLVDYPYLTYNDLFDVQQLLETQRGHRDPDLDDLMHAKRQWMEVNKVGGYRE